jgi:hypothetical protein
VVRPVIPGTLVTPAEQTLTATASPARVMFYVTPLVKGRIREARVEVGPPHGTSAEVTLPMRVVTQRLTKWLLLLTVVLPCVLFYYTAYQPLKGTIPHKSPTGTVWVAGNPGDVLEYRIKNVLRDFPEAVRDNVAYGLGKAYEWLWNLTTEGMPLSLYLAVALLVLTGASWLARRPARGRRRSKPLHFTRLSGVGSTTVPRGHAGEAGGPVVVRPIE